MTLEASLAVANDPPVPIFQNIVATVNLGCKVDLRSIALKARNSEYNPKRFHAVIMRIKDPKTTALVFSSGKMVVTGAKSETDSKKAARRFIRTIMKTGDYPELIKRNFGFKIQNLVASCDLTFPIRLETLAYSSTPGLATYEAEIFPGLIYRVIQPKVVFLIFASGKVVITGAKVKQDTFKAWELMYPLIIQHRRHVNSEPSSTVPSSVQEKSAPKKGRKKKKVEESSSASGKKVVFID